MKAVVQRVRRAAVHISRGTGDQDLEGSTGPLVVDPQHWQTVGQIGRGLCVLVGVAPGDADEDAGYLAEKIAHLRIFEDAEGKLNRSVLDVGGRVLVVSQFTLLADTSRGRRPGFSGAALPVVAEPLVSRVVDLLRTAGLVVQTGRFRAEMLVEIWNDGPVTILLESKPKQPSLPSVAPTVQP